MHKGFIGIGALLVLAVVVIPAAVIVTAYAVINHNRKFVLEDPVAVSATLIETPRIAVVFGSGLEGENGTPRPVLTSRLEAAQQLYFDGAIDHILVSGSTDGEYYSEPRAMRAYLTRNHIPEEAIIEDEAGDSTFDTCRNTRGFGLNDAVLVTQATHLSRAIYLCRAHGMDAYGYAAEPAGSPVARIFQHVRELGSNVRAVFDVVTGGTKR
jgi:SanA protein